MAWVICLISASRRIMSGASVPSGIRDGVAAAAVSVVILLLIALAVLGRTVPAWHDAIVNFFSALAWLNPSLQELPFR